MARNKRTVINPKPLSPRGRRQQLKWSLAVVLVLLVAAGGSLWFYQHSLAAKQPASADAIRELLEVTTQRTSLSTAAAEAMIEQLRKSPGAVNPKVVQIIPAEVDAFFADAMRGGLGDAMVPVFAQRFTNAEVQELLVFYRSPLGRKLAEEMPIVAGLTAGVAQRWTLEHWGELSLRIETALKREGITLPTKEPPPTTLLPAPAQ